MSERSNQGFHIFLTIMLLRLISNDSQDNRSDDSMLDHTGLKTAIDSEIGYEIVIEIHDRTDRIQKSMRIVRDLRSESEIESGTGSGSIEEAAWRWSMPKSESSKIESYRRRSFRSFRRHLRISWSRTRREYRSRHVDRSATSKRRTPRDTEHLIIIRKRRAVLPGDITTQ